MCSRPRDSERQRALNQVYAHQPHVSTGMAFAFSRSGAWPTQRPDKGEIIMNLAEGKEIPEAEGMIRCAMPP